MPQNQSLPAIKMMAAQQGKPAWATIIASLLFLSLFACTIYAHIGHGLSLFIAFPLCFIAIHMGFATAHEATHKTISNRKDLFWLDSALGFLHGWLLIYDFPSFKFLHLRHHINTNNPDTDPDYWLQNHSIPVGLILGLFAPLHYLRLYIRAAKKREIPRQTALFSLLRIAILITILLGLLIAAPAQTFFLWLAPASCASSIISISHRMLHTIEQSPDRTKTTLIIRGERFFEWVINPFFWLNNHHYLHHEYPKLPCYLHGKLFDETKAQLEQKGVKIITVGKKNNA